MIYIFELLTVTKKHSFLCNIIISIRLHGDAGSLVVALCRVSLECDVVSLSFLFFSKAILYARLSFTLASEVAIDDGVPRAPSAVRGVEHIATSLLVLKMLHNFIIFLYLAIV